MKDGGPAFPETSYYDDKPIGMVSGMSLRDWFAGQALAGLLAMCAGPHINTADVKETAAYAYDHADAMIAEREKGGT